MKDKPTAAVAYITTTLCLDITLFHFSAMKSADAKKGGIKVKVKGKRGRPDKIGGECSTGKTTTLGHGLNNGLVASPAKSTKRTGSHVGTPKSSGDVLEAPEKIKPLVASLGVARIKRLADLLGSLDFEIPAQGNQLREERFYTMVKDLGVELGGDSLKLVGQTSTIIDALDDALRMSPRNRIK